MVHLPIGSPAHRGHLRGWCGLVVLCLTTVVSAEVDEYEWRVSLGGSFQTGRVYKARLTPDFFDGSRSFPFDVKVSDKLGETWPSFIWMQPERGSVTPVRVTRVGKTEGQSEVGYVVKEFRVENRRRDDTAPIHNRVTVHVGGTDFVRRIEVWGGDDAQRLVLLGSGVLIEQRHPAAIRNRSVDYPDSDVPVIVVRVFDDVRHPDTSLEWRSTDVTRVTHHPGDHDVIDVDIVSPPAGELTQPGVLSIYLDAGARNRPLVYLDLETSLRDQALPVRVFGRNDPTNAWRWVADGSVHDMPEFRQTRIALARADYRFLRLDFFHDQANPPAIASVTAATVPHFLVFKAGSDKKAFAYLGSPRYQLPVTEFSRLADPVTIENAEEAALLRRQANPARIASSLQDYGRTLFRFGGGVVLLLGMVVTIRVVRNRYMK